MAMSDWYVRQFGDRELFSIAISLGRDPHVRGPTSLDASWGGLTIWARNRCLTRSVSSEGGTSDEIRWNLLSILQWLIEVGIQLINEEPFPLAIRSRRVRDGCEWFNDSEIPLLTLNDEEEDSWFQARSEWRRRHGLRRAADDAALPNIVFRRVGEFLEISWDNERWGASRPDLSFVERRGTELVSVASASRDMRAAMIDVTKELSDHVTDPDLLALATKAKTMKPREDDWKYLIHPFTAGIINRDLPALREKLTAYTRKHLTEWLIPHSAETRILRQARLTSAADVEALLKVATVYDVEPVKELVRGLIRPSPAAVVDPWRAGYERALEVREELNWGDDPIPDRDLAKWMSTQNIVVREPILSGAIDVVSIRSDDIRASALVNRAGESPRRRETGIATALGHILMDESGVAVDGTWEYWPSAARARAFGVMLLLPDNGLRKVLNGRRSSLDAGDVHRVMEHFGTGPYATTNHLENLGYIPTEERRTEILKELLPAA
jgi:hypothetical protein